CLCTAGTDLDGLLVGTHKSGPNGSDLTMVGAVTLRQVAVAKGGTRGDNVITTSDGRVLVSQSHQVDVLFPVRNPIVVATNPADLTVAALPLGLVTVTFDQDMHVGTAAEAGSVINPANYALTEAGGRSATISKVTYDPTTRTALLTVEGLFPGSWKLAVRDAIDSAAGHPLEGDYVVTFTAVSDFAADVDVDFTGTRLSRTDQTVTIEVKITNRGTYNLLLPL